jgi:putative hydrolase of the HAD superfamily
MTVEVVCFDLDDTLYDYHEYAEAGLRSAADLLEARTGEPLHDDLHDLYFEAGVTDGTFDCLLDRHDLPAGLVDDLVEAYHSSTESLAPYDDTVDVLSALASNHRLGLITDGRGGHAKLQRLGIGDHFDVVLVTPTIGQSKHEPTVFERTLSELSVKPSDAAYVGDDPRVDFRVPNELGMRTVRLRRGRYVDLEPTEEAAAPDHEIDELASLLGYIEPGIEDDGTPVAFDRRQR